MNIYKLVNYTNGQSFDIEDYPFCFSRDLVILAGNKERFTLEMGDRKENININTLFKLAGELWFITTGNCSILHEPKFMQKNFFPLRTNSFIAFIKSALKVILTIPNKMLTKTVTFFSIKLMFLLLGAVTLIEMRHSMLIPRSEIEVGDRRIALQKVAQVFIEESIKEAPVTMGEEINLKLKTEEAIITKSPIVAQVEEDKEFKEEKQEEIKQEVKASTSVPKEQVKNIIKPIKTIQKNNNEKIPDEVKRFFGD